VNIYQAVLELIFDLQKFNISDGSILATADRNGFIYLPYAHFSFIPGLELTSSTNHLIFWRFAPIPDSSLLLLTSLQRFISQYNLNNFTLIGYMIAVPQNKTPSSHSCLIGLTCSLHLHSISYTLLYLICHMWIFSTSYSIYERNSIALPQVNCLQSLHFGTLLIPLVDRNSRQHKCWYRNKFKVMPSLKRQ
jgi:hypothetical protein